MILLRLMFLLCVVLSPFNAAYGHALEPGYLDLRQLTDRSWQVFWRKPDVAGKPMAIDVRMPGSCVYPLDPAPKFDGAAWISAWVVDCPQGLVGKTVTLQGLEAQRTDVLVRYQPLDQTATTNRLTPTQNIFVASPEPTIIDVLASYFRLGFEHILEGWDHLLFVFALLILIRDIWRLIGAITAFTVAHSITLALAALGHVAIPGPPVEAIIALSIVFLAVELLKREEGRQRLSERAPWLIAFAFGL
ncbi:MAG: HupE/UreJ family protein, partial [Roseibium sp.]